MISILLLFSGCAINGYQMTYDYTLRDKAWNGFNERMTIKYNSENWTSVIDESEEIELNDIMNIKAEQRIGEHLRGTGTGLEGFKFSGGAEMQKREIVRVPDLSAEVLSAVK